MSHLNLIFLKKNLEGQCAFVFRELAKYDYFEFNLPLYYFFPSPYPFSAETILRFSKGKGVKRFELRQIWPQKKKTHRWRPRLSEFAD